MMKNPRNIFAASLVILVVGLVMVLVGLPRPVIAQFSGQGTWVPAVNVGGTASAVQLTIPNITGMADLLGVPLRFVPKNTSVAGGTTINVNSYGAENVLRASSGSLVAIAGGDMTASGPFAEVVWDGTEMVQINPATGNDAVGTEKSFTNTVPAGWLVEDGSCVSRTTYAALFAFYGDTDLWATQAGSSCSGTQFTVPKANGRISVAVQNQGAGTGPLTSCTAGITNNCGTQTISQAMLPSVSLPSSSLTLSNGNAPFEIGAATTGTACNINSSGHCTSGGNTVFSITTDGTQDTSIGLNLNVSAGLEITGSVPLGGSGSAFVPSNYQVYKAVKY